jgi:hypothetical protein
MIARPEYKTTRWPQPNDGDRWQRRHRVPVDQIALAWAIFLGRVPWSYFATLTFRKPATRELASREAFWWCGLAAHLHRARFQWVYAIERQTSGSWHAHVLITEIRGVHWGASCRAWLQRNGFANVRSIDDVPGMTFYTTKASATNGEIVISDLLRPDHFTLEPVVRVRLIPE